MCNECLLQDKAQFSFIPRSCKAKMIKKTLFEGIRTLLLAILGIENVDPRLLTKII